MYQNAIVKTSIIIQCNIQRMSFIGATGLNAFDKEIENTSNYVTRISIQAM